MTTNYDYFNKLDFDSLYADVDMPANERNAKQLEQRNLLQQAKNKFAIFFSSRLRKEQCMVDKFIEFEEIYNQLDMEVKFEFCLERFKFKHHFIDVLENVPTTYPWEVVYYLMYTAGWPQDVINWKISTITDEERNNINNIILLEQKI